MTLVDLVSKCRVEGSIEDGEIEIGETYLFI